MESIQHDYNRMHSFKFARFITFIRSCYLCDSISSVPSWRSWYILNELQYTIAAAMTIPTWASWIYTFFFIGVAASLHVDVDVAACGPRVTNMLSVDKYVRHLVNNLPHIYNNTLIAILIYRVCHVHAWNVSNWSCRLSCCLSTLTPARDRAWIRRENKLYKFSRHAYCLNISSQFGGCRRVYIRLLTLRIDCSMQCIRGKEIAKMYALTHAKVMHACGVHGEGLIYTTGKKSDF